MSYNGNVRHLEMVDCVCEGRGGRGIPRVVEVGYVSLRTFKETPKQFFSESDDGKGDKII